MLATKATLIAFLVSASFSFLASGCQSSQALERWVPCPDAIELGLNQSWGEADSDPYAVIKTWSHPFDAKSEVFGDNDHSWKETTLKTNTVWKIGMTIDECPAYSGKAKD